MWCRRESDAGHMACDCNRQRFCQSHDDRNVGGDDPNHPDTSLSLAAHASTFLDWHTTGYQTPHSPLCSHSRSPSQNCHSQGLRPRQHTSNSSVSSFGSSSPTESESDTRSSWGDSDDPERYRSGSPDVIFLGKAGDENGSDEEETSSLLDISNSDTEEVHTAAECRKVHQSDALYTAW